MTYTRKTLILIGRSIVESDPTKAQLIVDGMKKKTKEKDITLIPDHFVTYCEAINSNPVDHVGAVFNRQKSEENKIFIGAMLLIYTDHRSFIKTIASTLGKKQQQASRHVGEVRFRYKKDLDFKTRVDKIKKIFK